MHCSMAGIPTLEGHEQSNLFWGLVGAERAQLCDSSLIDNEEPRT